MQGLEDSTIETIIQSTIQAAVETAEEDTGLHVVDLYVEKEADVVLIQENDDVRREVRWH